MCVCVCVIVSLSLEWCVVGIFNGMAKVRRRRSSSDLHFEELAN